MNKTLCWLLASALCCFVAGAAAQESELPPPPKAPKSLKEKYPDLEKQQAAPEQVAPNGAGVPDSAAPRKEMEGRRPVRVRVVAPFVRVHVDVNQDQRDKAGVAPIDVDVDATGGGAVMGDYGWRYRFHEGRWWYWMPDQRWMVYENGRWVEFLEQAKQGGEVRLGTPQRSQVRLKIGDLPGLNLGF
jgi:hypothetical protein